MQVQPPPYQTPITENGQGGEQLLFSRPWQAYFRALTEAINAAASMTVSVETLAGAGTGAIAGIIGNGKSGVISIKAGSDPGTNIDVLRVDVSGIQFSGAPICMLQPLDFQSAGRFIHNYLNSSSTEIVIAATSLTAGDTYTLSYLTDLL